MFFGNGCNAGCVLCTCIALVNVLPILGTTTGTQQSWRSWLSTLGFADDAEQTQSETQPAASQEVEGWQTAIRARPLESQIDQLQQQAQSISEMPLETQIDQLKQKVESLADMPLERHNAQFQKKDESTPEMPLERQINLLEQRLVHTKAAFGRSLQHNEKRLRSGTNAPQTAADLQRQATVLERALKRAQLEREVDLVRSIHSKQRRLALQFEELKSKEKQEKGAEVQSEVEIEADPEVEVEPERDAHGMTQVLQGQRVDGASVSQLSRKLNNVANKAALAAKKHDDIQFSALTMEAVVLEQQLKKETAAMKAHKQKEEEEARHRQEHQLFSQELDAKLAAAKDQVMAEAKTIVQASQTETTKAVAEALARAEAVKETTKAVAEALVRAEAVKAKAEAEAEAEAVAEAEAEAEAQDEAQQMAEAQAKAPKVQEETEEAPKRQQVLTDLTKGLSQLEKVNEFLAQPMDENRAVPVNSQVPPLMPAAMQPQAGYYSGMMPPAQPIMLQSVVPAAQPSIPVVQPMQPMAYAALNPPGVPQMFGTYNIPWQPR